MCVAVTQNGAGADNLGALALQAPQVGRSFVLLFYILLKEKRAILSPVWRSLLPPHRASQPDAE